MPSWKRLWGLVIVQGLMLAPAALAAHDASHAAWIFGTWDCEIGAIMFTADMMTNGFDIFRVSEIYAETATNVIISFQEDFTVFLENVSDHSLQMTSDFSFETYECSRLSSPSVRRTHT